MTTDFDCLMCSDSSAEIGVTMNRSVVELVMTTSAIDLIMERKQL